MGECLLIGKRFIGLAPETGPSMLTTEIITSNTQRIPPSNMVGNQVSVTLFGGGWEGVNDTMFSGGGGGYGGGGGFYTTSMNGGGAAYGIYGHGGGNISFYSQNIGETYTPGSDGVCIIQYWAP